MLAATARHEPRACPARALRRILRPQGQTLRWWAVKGDDDWCVCAARPRLPPTAPCRADGGWGPLQTRAHALVDSLQSYFEQFGTVVDCIVMRDRLTQHPRGFGFVRYEQQEVADHVSTLRHVIDAKEVEAKPAVPRSSRQRASPPKPAFAVRKVFVGGLSHDTTEEAFFSYFDQTWGPVTDSVVMFDHHTHRPRGFGFVTFQNASSVDRICEPDVVHELCGKRIEVKRAVPQERHHMPAQQQRGVGTPSAHGAMGPGAGLQDLTGAGAGAVQCAGWDPDLLPGLANGAPRPSAQTSCRTRSTGGRRRGGGRGAAQQPRQPRQENLSTRDAQVAAALELDATLCRQFGALYRTQDTSPFTQPGGAAYYAPEQLAAVQCGPYAHLYAHPANATGSGPSLAQIGGATQPAHGGGFEGSTCDIDARGESRAALACAHALQLVRWRLLC